MLDYRLIEALDAVVDAGRFELAADRLLITQSAVSQRIRQLEERLGQVLLVRDSPPRPTAAGELLLAHFRKVKLLEHDLPPGLHSDETAAPCLPVGVNADSLATWFWPAVLPLLKEREVLFDLRVEDQDITEQLLRQGEVVGCISAVAKAPQGCRASYLGTMSYRLCATPEFCSKWFPEGLGVTSATQAPVAIYNRQDALYQRMLMRSCGRAPKVWRAHYVPAQEAYNQLVVAGQAYGCIPEIQCNESIRSGRLIDLAPDHPEPVHLYWHCWNLSSPLLAALEKTLRSGAAQLLDQTLPD